MRSINNHFAIDRTTKKFYGFETNTFNLVGRKIAVNNRYVAGQYIAVTGSILNDGVYMVDDFVDGIITISPNGVNDSIWDEEFTGTIYSLRVPQDFLRLVKRIEEFTTNKEGQSSNITSASFGIQSYSFATDENGVRAGWQTVFRTELHKYRRMKPDIKT